MMQTIAGLNELTDGSSPNPKILSTPANAAMQATNNALHLVSLADKRLLEKLSDQIIQYVQIAVKLGKVEGLVRALGSDTLKMLSINPDIALGEFGIFIEDAPSDDDRQMFLQDLSIKDSQGLISPADKLIVMSCRNLKQATKLLAYRVKKKEEQLQQQQLEQIQVNNQSQAQATIAIEEAKQKTLMMEAEMSIQKTVTEKMWEWEIEKMKKQFDVQGEAMQVEGRTIGHQIQGEAKIIASKISADAAKEKAKLKPKTSK
jgi:hypothetical protein